MCNNNFCGGNFCWILILLLLFCGGCGNNGLSTTSGCGCDNNSCGCC